LQKSLAKKRKGKGNEGQGSIDAIFDRRKEQELMLGEELGINGDIWTKYKESEHSEIENCVMIQDYISTHERGMSEISCAKIILAMISSKPKDVRTNIARLKDSSLYSLMTNEQISVIYGVFENSITILNGGPGTGKSTICKALSLFFDCDIIGLAPTGIAAKRLSDSIGIRSHTIHKALGFNGKIFVMGRNRRLSADLIIVDESSMIDIYTANALLRAIKDGARVVFVGDSNQLPSVGAGNFFEDLIDSKKINVYTLKTVFRFNCASAIGLSMSSFASGDYRAAIKQNIIGATDKVMLIDKSSEGGTRPSMIKSIYADESKNHGVMGIRCCTPTNDTCSIVNDYMMTRCHVIPFVQNTNDYTLGIFNGESGWAKDKDARGRYIINFDVGPVEQSSQTDVAFCTTVNKVQGLEFPCFIFCMPNGQPRNLNRRLIYTALTRGKKSLYIVGDSEVLIHTLENEVEKKRSTLLSRLINGKVKIKETTIKGEFDEVNL